METTSTTKKPAKKTAEAAQNPGLRQIVEVRAYFLSQQAGFEAGREMDFWLQAESETLATITPEKPKRVRKPRVKTEAAAE